MKSKQQVQVIWIELSIRLNFVKLMVLSSVPEEKRGVQLFSRKLVEGTTRWRAPRRLIANRRRGISFVQR